jgi:hypothetical protein
VHGVVDECAGKGELEDVDCELELLFEAVVWAEAAVGTSKQTQPLYIYPGE